MAKVALVTGCSSGLGRALACWLHEYTHNGQAMFRVFASARRLESLAGLQARGIECVQLDVTDERSVQAAVAAVLQAAGRIDVVVNNAGVSRIGPLAEQPLGEVLQVFDTNVMGVLRVTQAVAPGMAARRAGLVVLVGSVGSQLSSPFAGAYNASKAALLTLGDTLRLELAPWGVGVTYVMAGAIRSSISENASQSFQAARYESKESMYRSYTEGIRLRLGISQDPSGVMPAEAVAAQISRVIARYFESGGTRAPPRWFLAGGKALFYTAVGLLQKLVGWPTDGIMSKMFGLSRPPESDD